MILYWDTSAVLSALLKDKHSTSAIACSKKGGTHLISTLAWAETYAVVARMERDRSLATVLAEAAREALAQGPWRRVNALPDWKEMQTLAKVWPLRGADLWHLATAKKLRASLPELLLLSFDSRLVVAAEGEGFSHTVA